MTKQEEYHRARAAVIETARKLDVTLPLDEAAKLLPCNPEWDSPRVYKKRGRRNKVPR